MVKMIHAACGNEMWVHESRVEEYRAAGHKLAADPAAQQIPPDPPADPAAKGKKAKK